MPHEMPPVVYGPGYGKPRPEGEPETHVASELIIMAIQCRACEQWIDTWAPEKYVEKDAEGYSVPPLHACTGVN